MNLSINMSTQGLRLPQSIMLGARDRDILAPRINSLRITNPGRNVKEQPISRSRKVTPPLSGRRGEKKSSHGKQSDEDESDEEIPYPDIKLVDLLKEHNLLIKYKRGDKVVARMKKMLKKGAYNRFMKFKTDKKLQWSPQYFLDGDLTTLKGFMGRELLRLSLIDQLEEWAAADSDDSSATESESEEETQKDESKGGETGGAEKEDETLESNDTV